jgi:hypothetical protein
MTTLPLRRPKLTWRRLLLGSLGAGAVAGAVWVGRLATAPEAEAAPAPPAETTAAAPAPSAAAPAEPSDYSQRVVAYLYGSTAVTREQLGEYLIARFGPDRILNLVNKLIIERTCRERGIEVTDAEVDAELAEIMADQKVNRREFVEKVLREYHKSLYEWKEDVLRPKLLMTRLLRDQVRVQDEDVRKAFESAYGERVYCQAIMWPEAAEQELKKQYELLSKDPAEFTYVARTKNSKDLLAVGGMLDPVSHHSLDDGEAEKLIFSLKEGEVSPVFRVLMTEPDPTSPTRVKHTSYATIVRVLRKMPPNPTKKLDDMRPALEKEIIDAQVRAKLIDEMAKVQRAANPKIALKTNLPDDNWVRDKGFEPVDVPPLPGVPPAQQPVAYIYGSTAVTREQLGEYLIARFGADCVGLMVNKMIIEKECGERGIKVSEAEIEEALRKDIEIAQAGTKERFIKEYLRANRTTLYGYREDVLRPELLLAKLARTHVKVEAEDLKKAFEAYHGERAQCRIILWPRTPRDHEIAIKQWDKIRKSPDPALEFERTAKLQASAKLASQAGLIDPFGRHSTGNEELEREVFRLREGDMTPVVETPEGYVVARLVRRIAPTPEPADPAAAAAERAQWEEEILRKKAKMQIPAEFAKLREAAAPNLILRPVLREEDWMREVKQEITGADPMPPRPARN